MNKCCYKFSIGILEIVEEDNNLISLSLVNKLQENFSETKFIREVKTQLDEYFSGKRKHFNIKINPQGTEFQKKVWNELLKIPYAETKSYSEIARSIGNKNSSRAVGNACNKNPIMIIIPCHRVISKNGILNGYAYGINIKENLLSLENLAIVSASTNK